MSAVIRLANEADLSAIRDIYNYYVLRSTCTFQIDAETEEERRSWFRDRSALHPVTVAEEKDDLSNGGGVIGWAALSPWKSRCGYARSAEASVYVRPDRHRRGVGRLLLLDLIERARAVNLHTVIGGACTEHPASLALQESVGFQQVGHFRETGSKFGRWLDVTYMQLLLDTSADPPPPCGSGVPS